MREHPNLAVVRQVYEAVARGDRAAVRDVVAADTFRDVIAALDGDRNSAAVFQARTIVPLALAAAGDLVVAIDHVCARRGGRPLDVEDVVVFDVVDRKIARVTRLSDREGQLDVRARG